MKEREKTRYGLYWHSKRRKENRKQEKTMQNEDNTDSHNQAERTRIAPALANEELRGSMGLSAFYIAERLDETRIGGFGITKCTYGATPLLTVFDYEMQDELTFMPEELIEFCTKVLEKALETTKEGENHAEPAN